MAFSARLRRGGSRAADREPATVLVDRVRGKTDMAINSAVMFTHAGLALPLFGRNATFDPQPGKRADVAAKRLRGRLSTIMGVSASVRKLESWCRCRPETAIDYHLMVADLLDCAPPELQPLPSVSIHRALPEDTDRLFALQKSYELEEVYINPGVFDDRRCRTHLRRSLRSQVVYWADLRGIAVAKAGTNARGFHADQIGGVFTRDDLRGRGLATLTLAAVMEHVREEGKRQVSLFVKRANKAAIAAYRRLGFEIREQYRISYFTRI